MTDRETPAGDGAQDTPEEENPFAGFESAGYEDGEEVESTPPTPAKESAGSVDDDGGDDDDDDSSDDDSDGSDDSSRPKGKQTAQERINELTRLRREAERRAEAVEAELAELRQRAAPPEEPKAAAPKKPEAKSAEPEPPSPDDFDYGELDPRYIRALAGFEARQEFQKLRQEDEQKQAQKAAEEEQAAAREKFEKQIEEGSKKHDDFYEKVIVGAEKGEWPLSEHLGVLLVYSEVGDDIAYHLASHPEEAAQVFRQTPLEQARYFGRMEAKFTAGQSAATGEGAGKTTEPRTPKAPPPVTPARGSDGKFSPSASTKDFAAFEAHANNQ